MKIIVRAGLAALAAAAASGCTGADGSASVPAGSAAADASAQQQAALAQKLAGRTAGQPVSCVQERDLGSNESFGEGTILFHGRTDSVRYVNHPPGGCPMLTASRAISVRTTSGRLCRGDIITVFDPVSRFEFGSCGLGDFTPYRR